MYHKTLCATLTLTLAHTHRNIRTSQGTFMTAQEDPSGVLNYIEDKVASLVGLPRNFGEAFNILRYKTGQHYDSHYDYCMRTGGVG